MKSHTRIYNTLLKDIITLRLSPGKPLLEEKLAERFKVSRTPIRGILQRLNHEGFVEIVSKRGASVSAIEISDVRNIFQVREALEGIAARSATSKVNIEQLNNIEQRLSGGNMEEAARAGYELHQIILEAAENQRLLLMVEILKNHIDRLRNVAGKFPGRTAKSIKEHKDIIKALRNTDEKLVEEVMRSHIRSTMLSIFEYLQKP